MILISKSIYCLENMNLLISVSEVNDQRACVLKKVIVLTNSFSKKCEASNTLHYRYDDPAYIPVHVQWDSTAVSLRHTYDSRITGNSYHAMG